MKTNSVFKNDTQFFELKIKINNHVVAVFNLDTFLTRNRELSLSISYLFHIVTFAGNHWQRKQKALYLSVNEFSTKVPIGDTIFTSPTGDGTVILRGHPSHTKV